MQGLKSGATHVELVFELREQGALPARERARCTNDLRPLGGSDLDTASSRPSRARTRASTIFTSTRKDSSRTCSTTPTSSTTPPSDPVDTQVSYKVDGLHPLAGTQILLTATSLLGGDPL
jgi:hypothetical protein